MRLSAPLYHLKRRAKDLSRRDKLPLHAALASIAAQEGFASWSLLVARASVLSPAAKISSRLVGGDLLLVGARPGQGKTLLALELAVEAMKAGHPAVFYSLEYTERDTWDRLRALGAEPDHYADLFRFDGTDTINASRIMADLADATRGTLAIVDYLQALDHRRDNPDLTTQIQALRSFARSRGVIVVFIAQVDRTYDPTTKPMPDLDDIRLPNRLDLRLFDRTCFLNAGAIRFRPIEP